MSLPAESSVVAQVPIEVFYQTLVDYDVYPAVADELTRVEVLERRPGEAIVSFESKLMFRDFDYVLQMREQPLTGLTWTLQRSNQLRACYGGWRLERISAHETRATYHNELVPQMWLPQSFISAVSRLMVPRFVQRWARYVERRDAALRSAAA